MRAKVRGWQHAPSPSPRFHRPGRQGRTAKPAAPPSDPALRSFLEELADLAAIVVLERVRNDLNTKGVGEASIKSPRGFNREPGKPKMEAMRVQKPFSFDDGSSGIHTARSTIHPGREGHS